MTKKIGLDLDTNSIGWAVINQWKQVINGIVSFYLFSEGDCEKKI
jgi:CRISPR/Cas system Type II protein with McrA/HNH and RuvC-like nuclease domain